jgi:hypothetical protein
MKIAQKAGTHPIHSYFALSRAQESGDVPLNLEPIVYSRTRSGMATDAIATKYGIRNAPPPYL